MNTIVLDFPQEAFIVPRSLLFLSHTQQYPPSQWTAVISLVDDKWLIHESWSMVSQLITYQQWIYAFIPSLVYILRGKYSINEDTVLKMQSEYIKLCSCKCQQLNSISLTSFLVWKVSTIIIKDSNVNLAVFSM